MREHATPVAVLGTGSCAPDRVVSNAEVGAPAGVDDAWIVRKTAIRERRWAEPDQATSDLATGAARRALEAAGITADQLSTIVVATSTPDQQQPATAAFVHRNLGVSGTEVAAFDVNAVCAGFVYALDVVHALVSRSGGYGLAIGADVYSRILDPADARSVVLFGDGAGAAVVGPAGSGRGVRTSAFHFYSDMTELIQVPGGGSRRPYDPATHDAGLHYFRMDGRTAREFAGATVPGLVKQFLHDSAVLPYDVAHVIPHQPNGVMLDELAAKLDLPNATLHRTVSEFGNTGSASIPLTLDRAARSGALRRGDQILLVGMGGGVSIGLTLVEW
ncbi:3-oxoacyl-[acyl-carrier-protein] synthase 3 [Streptomyces lucensis JCM 4490]|uniref:3-oxoacyl-[acyl-carrier-protein] synthase 3 n=1 Tax=Streptomyces lucensis JCM 4490 TaxID=1306176 RepID=A0A918J346_9ACTN|nr:ketoacyl-ACP synthase III [Streptomyces lucensis]GGW42103.1 3-oxoacyl-[acyl-carrier-protein] synthase 3 [Streptomyces lucensis JCM 4490]